MAKTHIIERGGLTLQYHDQLNPVLFTGDHLLPSVRDHLLAIGHAFIEFIKVPDTAVREIIGTGGNFNFNYTNFSDIDVHIIVDKGSLNVDPVWLEDYFQTKKALWLAKHRITIKGYSVELYAQGLDDKLPPNSGIYSLTFDKWIQEPVNDHIQFGSNNEIEREADNYEDVILNMISKDAPVDEINKIRHDLYTMRINAIKSGGEFSTGNLIFKELRNRGLLDKMNDYVLAQFDKSMSEERVQIPNKKSMSSFRKFHLK